jgi:Glycosyl hydrolases family 38 C-terminal domain
LQQLSPCIVCGCKLAARTQVPLVRGDCNYTASDAAGAPLATALLATPRPTRALQALLASVNATEASAALRSAYALALQVAAPPLGYTSVFLAPRHGHGNESASHGDESDARAPARLDGTVPALEMTVVQAPPLATNAIEAGAAALGASMALRSGSNELSPRAGPAAIENEYLRLDLDSVTGTLEAIYNKRASVGARVQLDLTFFESTLGGGAYIMRPGSQARLPARALHLLSSLCVVFALQLALLSVPHARCSGQCCGSMCTAALCVPA